MNSELDVKLQPMTVVQIITWSLRYYRENFFKLIVLIVPGFAVWLTVFLFVIRFDPIGLPASEPLENAGAYELYMALSLFVFLFLSEVVTAVGSVAISGHSVENKIDVGKACRRVLDVGFPLLGTLMLTTIVITIGIRLFLIPGIIAYVWFCMAPPVVMIEREGGLGALKRSRAVVKDYFNKTFILVVPVSFIEILLALCVLFLPNLFGNLFLLYYLFFSTVFTILLILIAPLKIAATTMLYYDLRNRKEGYDLQALADELAELP